MACGAILLVGALHTGSSSGDISDAVRFLTIPARAVSARSVVELRLSIDNSSPSPRTYTVDLYVNTARIAPTINTTVAGSSSALVSVPWSPGSLTGPHTVDYQVHLDAALVSSGSWPLEVQAASTPALPYLTAMWIEPGHVGNDPAATAGDVRARVDEMHALRVDTLIIAYVEYGRPYYPSQIPELGRQVTTFDVIGTILDQASRNGMHVIVGLGRGPKGALNFDGPAYSTEQEMDDAAAFGERVAGELYNLYGHQSSFYGWYLSHEANDYTHAKYFYDQMARRLDQFGPEKPVLVAPAGTPIGIDTDYLNNSEVDIFAYQDAVGPGYVGPGTTCSAEPHILGITLSLTCRPYTYTYKPYNRIGDLDEIFSAYKWWHEGTRKHIWADTEIWQMDGPLYQNAYAAPCTRLRDQMAAEINHVEQMTGYESFGYLRSPQNTTAMTRKGAAELYDGYHAYITGATPTLCP